MFVVAAVVSVLLAVVLAGSALGKLRQDRRAVAPLTAVGVPPAWFPRLALAELAGAVGLVVGLFVWPIGVAAAIGVVAYFVGAVLTHVRAKDPNVVPPGALGALGAVAGILRAVTA